METVLARAAAAVLLAGAPLFLLTRPDSGPEARGALLALAGLVLATLDDAAERQAEETSWHEYEAAVRGMVG